VSERAQQIPTEFMAQDVALMLNGYSRAQFADPKLFQVRFQKKCSEYKLCTIGKVEKVIMFINTLVVNC
jgi:hypothetical protein